MKRIGIVPRANWQRDVERLGLTFHTPGGHVYWDESACYRFSLREIDAIEAATAELQRLCLLAAQYAIDNGRFAEFRIPDAARSVIRRAWEQEPPSIYGRFDLSYDGVNPPKLLEYNANTPTGLLEAAVVQWYWRREAMPATDQFNSIHEKLISQWGDIKPYVKGDPLYFASMRNDEDAMTATYLRDTAQQAGIETVSLFVRDIGWNEGRREFRDGEERRIQSIFALYPWEWLLKDFGAAILGTYADNIWIEPIWKMLWSNKALLAVLWELFPGHPNLLEAHLDGPHGMEEYVKKPLLSREGANITLHGGAGDITTDGTYGEEGFVWQALAPPAVFEDKWPVLGSWVVTDRGPAGIGIRESDGPITDNLSRFVPHYFE
jgi:glutathionylspermidine synthase